jgi:rubredoxin
MVVKTERDEMTWYKCEGCGMMFDDESDAEQHEANCDHEDPSPLARVVPRVQVRGRDETGP